MKQEEAARQISALFTLFRSLSLSCIVMMSDTGLMIELLLVSM